MAGHATGKADPHQGFRHHHHHHPESLALPSFSTYTYDSSDVDANYDGDAYSMEGSTNSDQNMPSPGGGGIPDGNGLLPGGGYTSKSSRYKMAMTTRARQRRLRRITNTFGGVIADNLTPEPMP